MIRRPEHWAPQLQNALPAMLLAQGWLVPKHEAPWLAFHSDMCAAAALVMAVMLGARQLAGPSVHTPSSVLTLLLLAAVPMLQWAAGLIHFSGDALMASLYLLGFAWAVLLGAQTGSDAPLGPGRIAPWLLGAALASTAIAGLQWLRIDSGLEWLIRARPMVRPYGNLAQPNLLASLLVLGQLAALGLHQWGKIGLRTLIMLSLMLWLGIAMSGSRTGRLELLVMLVWLLLVRGRARLHLSRRVMLTMAAFGLLFFTAWPSFESGLGLSRVQVTAHTSTRSILDTGTRPIHWRTLVDALQQSPLEGYGWNQVAVAQTRAALNHPASHEFIEHSHNLLIDLLVWNGLPLGMALIAAVLTWLGVQIKACRSPEAALWLAGLLSLLTHSMTEFPLEFFIFLLPLGLLVGRLEAIRPVGRTWRLPRLGAQLGGLMSLALLVAVALEYPRHEQAHRQMHQAYKEGRLMNFTPVVKEPSFTLLTQLQALPQMLSLPQDTSNAAFQTQQLAKLAERYAYAPVLERQARLLWQQGKPEAAQRSIALLCKLHSHKDCLRARELFGTGNNPE